MGAHVELTVYARERLPVWVSVIHQQVWVPGAVLLEASRVILNAIDRELGLIEETAANLFQVHSASVAAELASGLDHCGRLCATSQSGDQDCESDNVPNIQRASSFA
jgi:hypothetical protein